MNQSPTIFAAMIKSLLTTALLVSSTAYAINPADGNYGTIFLGPTYTPDSHFTPSNNFAAEAQTLASAVGIRLGRNQGTVIHSLLGNFGVGFGYRCAQLRGEGEFVYNISPYGEIKYGNISVSKKKATGLGITGQTAMGALMINGFYDFFTPGSMTSFVPYVGVGLGYSRIQNKISFFYNNVGIPNANASVMANTPAGQGIVGASYFLDDFSAFSLDYRYFTTKKVDPFNQRLQISSLNLSFTGALNFG